MSEISKDDILTVGDLIDKLRSVDPELPMTAVANGAVYPVFNTEVMEADTIVPYPVFELKCGYDCYEEE